MSVLMLVKPVDVRTGYIVDTKAMPVLVQALGDTTAQENTTMANSEMLRPLATAGGHLVNLGIFILLLGILALALPQYLGMTVSVMVGILLLLSGIGRTAFAWLSMGWGSMMLKLLLGLVTIAAGGYMIFNPDVGARALAILLTVYLLLDGITALLIAARIPPGAGGAWVMFGAVTSLLAGILMWTQWPASGDLAIGILIGIKLCIDGIELIGIGKAAKRLIQD